MTGHLIEARVLARRQEAADIVSLRLAAPTGGAGLPGFDAGAHIDVHLPNGLVRKYSLCNDPAEAGIYEIAVKLEQPSRGGSRWLHETVGAGDTMRIGVPQNLFPLAAATGRSVLLAAGIGITPILAMARVLARDGRAFDLHYFARSPDAAAYRSVLADEPYRRATTLHFGLDADTTQAALGHAVPDEAGNAHLYFCGPPAFMAMAQRVAAARLPPERVHWESFAPAEPTDGVADAAFEIELARSGMVLAVAADQSITDVLYENAIPIDTSCEAGICGSCRTAVLAGTPLHRDEVLSPAERARNDCLLPCVSRCTSGRLVLDL
jgi:vanillate O-demethylase ferredoxin subunit